MASLGGKRKIRRCKDTLKGPPGDPFAQKAKTCYHTVKANASLTKILVETVCHQALAEQEGNEE